MPFDIFYSVHFTPFHFFFNSGLCSSVFIFLTAIRSSSLNQQFLKYCTGTRNRIAGLQNMDPTLLNTDKLISNWLY